MATEDPQATCWTMIHAAADGHTAPRDEFAERYEPVIRAYLAARWPGGSRAADVDDAVQQTFVECYRAGGALEKAAPNHAGGFRAFLYGIARNVARRVEQGAARHAHAEVTPADEPHHEDRCSLIFDRAWAASLVRLAARRQAERASDGDETAQRRVELLRLRFQKGLPIRDIAARWEQDPVLVHREYAKARREFRDALLDVVSFHHPDSAAEAEAECLGLLALLE